MKQPPSSHLIFSWLAEFAGFGTCFFSLHSFGCQVNHSLGLERQSVTYTGTKCAPKSLAFRTEESAFSG